MDRWIPPIWRYQPGRSWAIRTQIWTETRVQGTASHQRAIVTELASAHTPNKEGNRHAGGHGQSGHTTGVRHGGNASG
jgi:hypothetical protein